jgi:hypothetical protein
MKIFLDFKCGVKVIGAAMIFCSALATTSLAAAPRFSFIGVEFMPEDQRQPAAEAFVSANLAPGTPLATAEAALSRAGAYCGHGRRADGVIVCSLTSVVANSGEDSQGEVTWRVEITPDANGAVRTASVRRLTAGF